MTRFPHLPAVLIALGAVAILVPGLVLLAGGTPPPAPAAPGYAFLPGQRASYDLSVESRVGLGAEREVRQELAATLELCVLTVTGEGAEVGLELTSVRLSTDGQRDPLREAALLAPFTVRLNDGAVGQVTFPVGLAAETCQMLESLPRTFQCAAPPAGESELRLYEDGLGRYRASCQRTADGNVTRTKAAYLSGTTPGGVPCEVRVLAATATFELDAAGPWLRSAEVNDELELSSMGSLAAKIVQRAELRLRAGAATATAAATASAWLARSEHAVASSRVLAQAPAPLPVPRVATDAERNAFRAALSAFVAGEGEDNAAVHALARHLAELPELAAEVGAVLRRGDLAERAGGGLCHALELAGGEACQDVLASLGDPALRPGIRFCAAVALGGVARPTAAAEAALWHLAGDSDRELAVSARLALGNLGKALRQHDPKRYRDLSALLTDEVARTVEVDASVVALRALRNTHDPELASVALQRLADASAPVRAAAAETVAALGGSAVSTDLDLALRRETDPRVRVALARGLAATGDAARATASCAALVEHETDEAARGAMACVLADNLVSHPEVRPVLERLLGFETSAATVAYVAGRLHRRR